MVQCVSALAVLEDLCWNSLNPREKLESYGLSGCQPQLQSQQEILAQGNKVRQGVIEGTTDIFPWPPHG